MTDLAQAEQNLVTAAEHLVGFIPMRNLDVNTYPEHLRLQVVQFLVSMHSFRDASVTELKRQAIAYVTALLRTKGDTVLADYLQGLEPE